MKIQTTLLALFSFCLLLPLHAQTTPGDDAATTSLPAPPRNIMPLTLNHKPNATQPPEELRVPLEKFFRTLKTGDYSGRL